MKKPDMRLDLPDILKVVLVDDWESVTKNNQVRSFHLDVRSYPGRYLLMNPHLVQTARAPPTRA